jgi:hypothetical protein
MRSVADDLRHESMQALGRLDPIERLMLALRLGDADVALYQSVHGMTELEARARLSRARTIGRHPSPAHDRSGP